MRKLEGKYGMRRLTALAVLGLMLGSIGFASGEIRTAPVPHQILEDGTDDGTPPYKDENRSIEERVEDLLSRMTLDEKIEQMHGDMYDTSMMSTPYNDRLGIPGINFTDGPRGPRWGYTTTFPVSMARGSTWNPELEHLVGAVMGNETKARGRDCLLAPCINLVRDPHGGRSQETYGEDTWHVGRMAVGFIEGVQSQKVMACAKHYAANNDENQRFIKNSIVDPKTLHEIYLPHFRAAVEEANVASVMTSYNRVNGEYGSANYQLLREILKGEWDFNGFVVSDWFATAEPFMSVGGTLWAAAGKWGIPSPPNIDPNITKIKTPTSLDAIQAGLDIEMPEPYLYNQEFNTAAKAGQIPQYLIDDAVRGILRKKFEFGLFDEPKKPNDAFVETSEHINLTREVEREAIVLLKNENQILPLLISNIKSIAVIGPAADDKDRLGDHGSSNAQPTPSKIVTPLQGIKNKVGDKVTIYYSNGFDINEAVEMAKKADIAVLFAGLSYKDEGEGYDRESLGLPDNQDELIESIVGANKNAVVVLIGGSAITMPWVDKIPGILMAWYYGMEGGNAIADVLFGDYNPGGKLPITFPKSEDQLPAWDSDKIEDVYQYYHGYRWFDKQNIEPLFPFGYGLSYTTFEYSNLKLSAKTIQPDGKIKISIDVKNTGKVAGDDVVQLYIGYEGSAVDRSVKDLKGFDKVFLQPGEKQTVTIEVAAENISYYSAGLGKFVVEPITYDVLVGASSRDIRETGSFRVSENPSEIGGESKPGSMIPGFEVALVCAALWAIALAIRKKGL